VSYNATSNLVRFENKNDFFYIKNALAYHNAGGVPNCKLRSRRIGSRFTGHIYLRHIRCLLCELICATTTISLSMYVRWQTKMIGGNRVARSFLVQHTKMGKRSTIRPQNIPNGHKIYKIAVKYTK
jgi:hypothetical protein